MSYNFREVEKKWQDYWEENNTFFTDVWDFSKPKFYALDMFPYPSGQGLHVGHPEGYTATDIVSRMKRMQGYNVLHPMGWDAFGLPAEQYAIKTGNHPAKFTEKNIATFKRQLKMLGLSFDWDKEISTCDPKFYKWTQWIFKQLYNDGLAKLVEMPVNWCEELGCVLSNDEVINGKSERGGFPVVRKKMKQWVMDIPKYADILLDGLDDLDWPESTKEIQRNWIGRSEGAEVVFGIDNHPDITFTVFTTRPDTLFGATYCVFAPEHDLVKTITTDSQKDLVENYIKSGVMTGGLKEEIENALKEKFDYTSNFLNQFNWEESNGIRYFAYAMLNKKFEFNQAFDDLNKGSFAGKGTDTKYFGLNANMNEGARSQVQVLYYNNENDKAILLETKQGDEVIIAMTNKMKNFNQVYEKITTESKNYQGNKALTDVEELKIPNLSIDTEKEFTDLENKEFEDIDGNKMKIDKALQTIDFSLDKTGGQVVSEAGMSVQQNGIEELEDIRNFNFDKEFVVFVREKDKTLPYFALNVSDIEDFQ